MTGLAPGATRPGSEAYGPGATSASRVRPVGSLAGAVSGVFKRPSLATTASHAVVVPVPRVPGWVVRYGAAAASVVVAFLLTLAIEPVLRRAITVFFWPAVVIAAWFGGVGPAVLAVVLAAALTSWAFLPPVWSSLVPADPLDIIPLAAFVITSSVVVALIAALQEARRTAALAATRNAGLAEEVATQAQQIEQQLEEAQVLSEELEQTVAELADRTGAAEAAERRLATVLDGLPDAAVLYDADWRIRYLNPASEQAILAMGREPAAVLGAVVWEAFPELEGTHMREEMLRAVAERRMIRWEERTPVDGGSYETCIVPTADGAVLFVRDTTEERRTADALRSAKEQAESGNKAKLEFLATMSHELRTPLNAIGGYAELLSLGLRGPVNDAQREDLARIQRSQQVLLGLINDVLNFVRIDAGRVRYEIADVPVGPVIEQVE